MWCGHPDSNWDAEAGDFKSPVYYQFHHARILWCVQEESNLYQLLRRELFYPLKYERKFGPAARNRTWINSLEGYCTIHCATARKLEVRVRFELTVVLVCNQLPWTARPSHHYLVPTTRFELVLYRI